MLFCVYLYFKLKINNMTTQQKQMLKLAQKEQLNLRNNNVSLNKEQLFIGAQFQNQQNLLTILQIEGNEFIFSAIDCVLLNTPDIKSKVEDFILKQSDLDVFDEMLKDKLKTLELNDVLEVAQILIEVNGSVTNLEIKQQLRDNGFRCDQRNVSDFANKLYLENFLKIKTVKDNYRIYIAGDKMQFVDLNFTETENDIKSKINNQKEIEIEAEFKTLQERNDQIIQNFNSGETIKSLTEKYKLSERQIRRIISGK